MGTIFGHKIAWITAVLLAAVLLLGKIVLASNPAPSVVVLSDMESVAVDDSGRFHVRKELLSKALDEQGADSLERQSIHFDAATDTVIIEAARIRLLDGTWRNADVNGFETPITAEAPKAPDYERFSVQSVVFPKMKPGMLAHLVYRIEPKPGKAAAVRKGGVVLFGGRTEVVDKQFILKSPAKRAVNYLMQNSDVQPVVSEENGSKVYAWTFHNCPQVNADPNAVELENVVPRLSWTVFPDWDALGIYAGNLFWEKVDSSQGAVDGFFQITSPDLRGLPALMNAALWTALNIHTVDLPLCVTGYLPLPADRIWQNRYGTSLDKAVLLTAIVRAYGFNPVPVLVPYRDVPFADVPVMEQFRRVILAVPSGDDTVWLDAAAEAYPPGDLPHACTYGMGCMLVAGAPLITKVPATAEKEPTLCEIRATLDSTGRLSGFAECTPKGDPAAKARRTFGVMGMVARSEYFERTVQKVGPRASAGETYVSNVADMVSGVSVKVNFEVPDFAQRDSGKLVFNIPDNPFDFAECGFDTASATTLPVEFPAHGKFSTVCGITLPEGYRLISVPPPLIIENPYLHIELSTRILPHGFEWNKVLEIRADQVPPADYATVRSAFQALKSAKNRQVVVGMGKKEENPKSKIQNPKGRLGSRTR